MLIQKNKEWLDIMNYIGDSFALTAKTLTMSLWENDT